MSNLTSEIGVNTTSLDTTTISEHKFIVVYCAHCGCQRVVYSRCGVRSCPTCRSKDYFRILGIFKPFLAKRYRLRMITLTLAYRRDVLLKERIKRIRKAFKKLLRAYPFQLKGGFYSIEAKISNGGWNVHIHVLAEGYFILQRELSDTWLRITGDSLIVDIRKASSELEGFKYVIKYLLKSPDVRGFEAEYNEAFKGVRMVSAFGSWYRRYSKIFEIAQKEYPMCPCCGHNEWITEFEVARLFYWSQRIGSS